VPVTSHLVDGAMVGDEVVVRDTRGRRRTFVVTTTDPVFIDATCEKTSYLGQGLRLERRRDGLLGAEGEIGELPPLEPFVWLCRGDRLRIERGRKEGHAARLASDGTVAEPAVIGCELDTVFDLVEPGHRVLIDDGAIECVIDSVEPGAFEVVVQRPSRAKLKAEKGMNLPDTNVVVAALTDDDRAALSAIAPVADLVSLSFVRTVDDLVDLRRALDDLGRPDVAVGLKIEHAVAFAALPRLLLGALQRPPVTIMLARGDLAIEVGFERLAEVQEEVLWLCEAAHIPVIWATQVAESMAKDGIPTRAEVTDAAGASRAECIMLNKGPHIIDALHFVNDVLGRMQEHQDKRTPLLRRLAVSDALGRAPE
jgi:pyruvate kinase